MTQKFYMFWLGWLMGVALIQAQEAPDDVIKTARIPEIVQRTTHPRDDLHPALSPDGRWLAFASSRSGNLDLWVKPAGGGVAIQVTRHQADDFQPAWTADGQALIFVSRRRDSQGDLWMVRVNMKRGGTPRGQPSQLTYELARDLWPSPSPDGGQLVYASDRGGELNLWLLDIKTRATRPLTRKGGLEPAWSPDGRQILFTSFRQDPGGDLMLLDVAVPDSFCFVTSGPALDGEGAWSSDGKTIAFRRYGDDSDGDGRITPSDFAAIWRLDYSESNQNQPWQVTTAMTRNQGPVFAPNGRLFFASTRSGSWDVWAMPGQGLFPRQETPSVQYSRVMERSVEFVTPYELHHALLGYQRLMDWFPSDSLWAARALIQQGELWLLLNRLSEARRSFSQVIRDYSRFHRERLQAELRLASQEGESRTDRMRRCREIIRQGGERSYLSAEAWLVLGDLHLEAGQSGEALQAYNHVVNDFAQLTHMQARAQLKIGDLFLKEDQPETARQSYLSALRQFNRYPLWRKRAGDRLMAMVRGSREEKVSAYRQIILEAGDLPVLAAEAQLSIGRELMGENPEAALSELDRMEEVAPGEAWAHARALILQAQIYGRTGDALKGIYLLEATIGTYATLEGGLYRQEAETALFDLLLDSARELAANGDWSLAEARFRKARLLQPKDIRVLRGLCEAAYRNGRIESFIHEMNQELERQPEDPLRLYVLGLAWSYWGERDAGRLEQSNTYLTQSLAEDYRLIYPYRTLGFNYELLERLEEEEAARPRSVGSHIWHAVTSPFRWAYGLLPWVKEKQPRGYYEEAIDALITALEINDETEDPQMEALLAQNLANNFYNLGEFGFRRALEYYQYRLSLDSTFAQPLEEAVFYQRAGHCGTVLENRTITRFCLERAMAIYARFQREEDVLRNRRMLAFHCQLSGEHESAIDIYKELAARDTLSGRWDDAQRNYRNIAFNYHQMHEYEDVIRYASLSARILLRQPIKPRPSKKSKLRIEILGFSIPVWGMEEIGGASSEAFTPAQEAALLFGLLSRNYEALKNFTRALDYERQRLDIFKKRKDRLAQRVSLNRLGLLYFKNGELKEAWERFHASWKANKKRKDSRGRWITAVNLGHVAAVEMARHQNRSRLETALDLLDRETRRLLEEEPALERERLVLLSLRGSLILQDALQMSASPGKSGLLTSLDFLARLPEAESQFSAALELARKNQWPVEETVLLKNLAETCRLAGDDGDAYLWMRQAIQRAQSRGDEAHLWRLYYGMGQILIQYSPGVELPALTYFERAMTLLEGLPVLEANSEIRQSDRRDRWTLYRDAALEMARQGLEEEALQTVERGRMKQVADMMARRPPVLKKERHKVAWGNLRYLRTRLHELGRLIREHENDYPLPAEFNSWEEEYRSYRSEYQELLAGLGREDKVLAYLSGAGAVPVDSLRLALPDDVGALVYITGPRHSLVWMVDSRGVRMSQLEVTAGGLRQDIQKLIMSLDTTAAAFPSKALYDQLIKPVESFVDGKLNLMIIPDGALWSLPFEILTGDGMTLAERASVIYGPSLASGYFARSRPRVGRDLGLLLGGEPIRPLAGSLGQAVNRLESFLGADATETHFLAHASDADLIQVGRWMLPRESDPLTTMLVMKRDGQRDGYLHVFELFENDLKAGLTVLPPPAGGLTLGPGALTALNWGLLYAGAPAQIVARWPVSQAINTLFWTRFYQQVSELSLADALMDARLFVKERYPHPKAWGGFLLLGSEGLNRQERVAWSRRSLQQTVMRARALRQMGEPEDAVQTLKQAADMALTLGDSTLLFRVFKEIVYVSARARLWSAASQYQEKVLAMAESQGDDQALAQGRAYLSAFYQRSGLIDDAIRMKEEALNRTVQPAQRASLYEEMAAIYASGRQFQEAARWSRRSVALYDSLGMAQKTVTNRIKTGRFLLEAEAFWDARIAIEKGLADLPRADLPAEEEKNQRAAACQLLGLALEKLTDYPEAMNYQLQALNLLQGAQQPVQLALGHQYVANLHWKMGQYREALSRQQEALRRFRSLNQRKLEIMGQTTLGLIYLSLGDLDKARTAEQNALDLASTPDLMEDRSTVLKNMGLIAIQDQHPEKARNYFEQAVHIDSSLGLKRGLAYGLRNLGMLDVRQDRVEQGLILLRQSESLSRQIGDLRNRVQCSYGLGLALHLNGQPGRALAVLDSGIQAVDRLSIPDLEWRLLRQKGRVLIRQKQQESALTALEYAVDIVERLRSDLKVEAFKEGFLDDKADLYVDVVDLLLSMNRPARAFAFAERAKSRNFIDMLAHQDVAVGQAHGALLKRENRASDRLEEALKRLRSFDSLPNLTPVQQSERAAWQDSLQNRRQAYQEVRVDIEAADPQLASLVSVDPWPLERVQAALPDSAGLLEYFITGRGLYWWLATRKGVQAGFEMWSVDQAETLVRQFREAIQAQLPIQPFASQLYHALFSGLDDLDALSHLIIIPHGPLHYLPFAALTDGDGRYLLERFSLSFAPSATVYGFCLQNQSASPVQEAQRVAAFCNPDLGDFRMNLPFAEKEVQSLQRSFSRVDAYVGGAATEAAVHAASGDAQVLHFACHGEYVAGAPLFSALLLAEGEGYDGRLEAHEIFGLKLQCDLVMLSACETGLAQITRGDEVIGLARGFIFAGASSVITSLWKVDDLATAVLVKRFYRYLKAGDTRAQALRRAQLLVKERVNPHASAWAAFGLTGAFE